MFLILPAHRKFIKLLRDRANSGNPVVMTKVDYDDFLDLIRTTKKRGERHRGLYRITLRALHHTEEDIEVEGIYAIIDNRMVNLFAKTLAKAERRSLGATLKGAYLVPFLRFVLKRMERRKSKR
jgi:hypothetical protein